jgi:predicted DNA-binding transcriptional regulator YafY
MRADRLLSILMLLQTRGRVTEGELAESLEVTTRTIHRDLEALSTAGVPVYAQRGRGGGWSLIGGYRTDLSGLSEEEARALFLVAGPAAAAGLDLAPAAHSALRKLLAALPAHYRPAVERVRSGVHVDPARWWHGADQPVHLHAVRDALTSGRRLWMRYDHGAGPDRRRLIDPHGLVQKAGTWYLLAVTRGELRTFRVSRIHSITPAPGASRRPAAFDVAAAWEQSRTAFEKQQQHGDPLSVTVRVREEWIRTLRGSLSAHVDGRAEEHDRPGWAGIRLRFRGIGAAAAALAGFVDDVEVIAPDELRTTLEDIGRKLFSLYATEGLKGW